MEQCGLGIYRLDEIRTNIDVAIELTMTGTEEKNWDIISEVRTRLYEKFEIIE